MIHKLRTGYIIASILMLALGLYILIEPQTSMELIVYLLGAFFILHGIFRLFGYFSNILHWLAFQFDFALGLLSILFGILLLMKPEWMMQYFTILMGIYLVVDSLFTLQIAIEGKRLGIKHWWLILLTSLIACVLGVLLVINPWQWAVVLTGLLGVGFIAIALRNLFIALYSITNDF